MDFRTSDSYRQAIVVDRRFDSRNHLLCKYIRFKVKITVITIKMYHVANNTKRYLSFPMSMKDKVSTEVLIFITNDPGMMLKRPCGIIRITWHSND